MKPPKCAATRKRTVPINGAAGMSKCPDCQAWTTKPAGRVILAHYVRTETQHLWNLVK